mmetsp:Transcript_6924/g.12389  ORF Transcript_6924/g.12389 Transcript_6924/m.12389 type:complete len:81 (-) Transcript_6924:819-1061(-)
MAKRNVFVRNLRTQNSTPPPPLDSAPPYLAQHRVEQGQRHTTNITSIRPLFVDGGREYQGSILQIPGEYRKTPTEEGETK